MLGIDVGLKHLTVTSDGSKFDLPRHVRPAKLEAQAFGPE